MVKHESYLGHIHCVKKAGAGRAKNPVQAHTLRPCVVHARLSRSRSARGTLRRGTHALRLVGMGAAVKEHAHAPQLVFTQLVFGRAS
jgi:hypothetical protein